MIRIYMNGCCGRMGRVIYALTKQTENMQIVAGGDLSDNTEGLDFPVFKDCNDCDVDFDVIIDFSHFAAVPAIINFALAKNKPLVCCTTRLEEDTVNALEEASKTIPVFKSANMSLGINVLNELVQRAAKALYPDFDIEIVEAHHNRKIDAPSGTAIMIADAISEAIPDKMEYVYERHSENKPRTKNEIGISAIRGGNIVGEHEVYFISDEEIVKVSHSAQTRDVFAKGAIKAAEFIVNKPAGYYSMKEVIAEAFND